MYHSMYLFNNLVPGENPPEDVNVIIEISKGSNIKYELNSLNGFLYVDRILTVEMIYPFNYGSIPSTMENSENLVFNNDNLDAFIIGIDSLYPGSVINCIPVGVILTEDQSGSDTKIILTPSKKINSNNFELLRYLDNNKPYLINKLIHFIKHHKDLEKGKFVKIKEIGSKEKAKKIISDGIKNHQKYINSLRITSFL